jgi:hypothetical protein
MSVAYGHEVTENDHYVSMVEAAAEKVLDATFPGAAALNMLPFRS